MTTNIGFAPIGNLAPPVPGLPDQADLNPLLTRTHYFDGRLLTAADLTRDQVYLDQRLREVGQSLGNGVVRGLSVTLEGGRISLTPGIAVNAAGRVLRVKSPILVDLNDRAAIAGQNEGQYLRLPRALYALVLRFVEEGRGIAEVFPQDLAGRTVQYDVFAEGVQATLVPLPIPLPQADPLTVRSGLMRKLADGGLAAGVVPEDGVALGVLAVRDDRPEWLDTTFLRQPLRAALGPGDLQADIHRQYEALLADLLERRRPLDGDFAASDHFRILPPTGRLPKAAVDPVAGRQGFFPEHFRVWISPIRRSDLELVQRESLRLPAIDLSRDEPVDLVVLAPLTSQDFGRYAGALERQPDPNVPVPRPGVRPTVLMPHLDLLALRLYPVRPVHQLDTDAPAWQALWDQVGDTDPVFVRRPTRAAESGISGIRIAQGAPIELVGDGDGGEGGDDPGPSPADEIGLVLDEDALLLRRIGLERLGSLRPPGDDPGRQALSDLRAEFGDQAPVVLASVDLLLLLDRRFDPVMWQTLLAAARAGVLAALRDGLVQRRVEEPDAAASATLIEVGTAIGLDAGLLADWEAIAALG